MTARVKLIDPDERHGRYAYIDDELIGRVYPAAPRDLDGDWYGKPVGRDAMRRPTEKEALDCVVGQPYELEEES